jgi:hypothetical protein
LEAERRKQALWRGKCAIGGALTAGKRKHRKGLSDQQSSTPIAYPIVSPTAPRVAPLEHVLKGRSSSSVFISKKEGLKPLEKVGDVPDDEPPVSKYGKRISRNYQPSPELIEWSEVECPDVKLSDALPAFVDYWIAVSGKNALKLDWHATFRNRMRELQVRARNFRGSQARPVGMAAAAVLMQRDREERERDAKALEESIKLVIPAAARASADSNVTEKRIELELFGEE